MLHTPFTYYIMYVRLGMRGLNAPIRRGACWGGGSLGVGDLVERWEGVGDACGTSFRQPVLLGSGVAGMQ